MKKAKFYLKLFIMIFSLVVVSMAATYFYFSSQVLKLKDHYPVWDAKSASYKLIPQKPSHWLKHELMSEKAKWAIVISEDWAFYQHNGIDLNQLKIVVEETVEKGKFVRGASTITQQVVKNALLSSERSLFRKGKEILMALLLERNFTKDEILEIYLNLIELGDGVYGVKSASYYYFKKPPSLLNAKEGAFLAMLLPSPVKYSTSFRQRQLTPFAKEIVAKILTKLRQAKVITEEERLRHHNDVLSFEDIADDLIDDDILSTENESY